MLGLMKDGDLSAFVSLSSHVPLSSTNRLYFEAAAVKDKPLLNPLTLYFSLKKATRREKVECKTIYKAR